MNFRYNVQASLSLACLSAMLCILAVPASAQIQVTPGRMDREAKKARSEQQVNVTPQTLQAIGKRFKQWEHSQRILAQRKELRSTANIDIDQILAYDELKDRQPDLKVYFSEDGLPICMQGKQLYTDSETGDPTATATAYAFLDQYRALMRIDSPRDEFEVSETIQGIQGRTHIRMQQIWKSYPVWGKEIIVHLNARGDVDYFTGRYTPSPALDNVQFTLAPQTAVSIAATDIAKLGVRQDRNALSQAILPVDRTSLPVIYTDGNGVRTAYVVELHPNLTDRWRYFIDAGTGGVLRKYNAACSDGPEKAQAQDLGGTERTLDTYLHQGSYYLIDASRPMFDLTPSVMPNNPIGAIWTIDATNSDLTSLSQVTSTDNTWTDASSVSAHYNAAQTYEYFRTVHGRNSIDNEGSTIISVVNVTDQGQDMPNAFWNGQFISYGNGGSGFDAFAGALDIAAHEMAHGVTEHSANLEYLQQSGALNESFSDIFGSMVDRDDWLIGEDITPTNSTFPSGAIRSMEDPHNGASSGTPAWQPKHMNEYQDLPVNQDNGGVHINSGIPNHVAYLIATSLGKDAMEAIMYNALTTKLTRQSQFIDFRLAIIQAAQEIYGPNAAGACAQACDEVGITDGSGTGDPEDLFPIEATDKMLYYSGDPADPYYLWTVTSPGTNPNDYTSLSATPPISKPTVTDDGHYALFVDWENNIRIMNLDPTNFDEQTLDNSGIWRQVAVSKDGNRLAVLTKDESNIIYVFDLEPATPLVHEFEVLTPNYTELGVPNTALYADAMDFSADNQTLIYDCLNRITIDGYMYDFWDINTMQVWDANAGDFGSGNTERIFSQDPRFDLSFPSFSKNSPYIFTFDVFDKFTNRAFIFTADIYRQTYTPVVEINSFYGTPNYNGDDSMISFSTVPTEGPFAGSYVVYNQPMAADKLNPDGDATIFLPAASEPVWYRQGQRPVSVEQTIVPTHGFELNQNYPNPFNPATTINYTVPKRTHVSLVIFDRLGRKVRSLYNGILEPGTHSASWDGTDQTGHALPSGIYFYRLLSGDSQLSKSMLLAK